MSKLSFVRSTMDCYGFADCLTMLFSAARYGVSKHILRRRYMQRRVFDYSMLLDLDDRGISKTLVLLGKREMEHRYILQKILKPGMTVMDIGANLGYYVMMEAGLVGPTGMVYAIEPSPGNFSILEKNIALNKAANVQAFNLAISNKVGEAEFFLSELSNLNTFHPGSANSAVKSKNRTNRSITVKTEDIRTFIVDKRSIDLIRMDIEGHEVEVFENIAEAVVKDGFSAMILFETHISKYNDASHNMRKQLQRLFALGYKPVYCASSDEKTTVLRSMGYTPETVIKTDFSTRGIYTTVSLQDLETCVCDKGGIRTVLLQK
ncbi:MAG TPA: FkbM family methyltransferase [Candidatus Omnitrophota bacterium]|nr:FkbM family methyltransferase [Candidatus Omnitrophota bacterium]HRZ15556.1 FkbM family methyltransferase [Candidatus Omnitrophota bacterium]